MDGPVEVEYTDGTKAVITVPTQQELADRDAWMDTQLADIKSLLGSLLVDDD